MADGGWAGGTGAHLSGQIRVELRGFTGLQLLSHLGGGHLGGLQCAHQLHVIEQGACGFVQQPGGKPRGTRREGLGALGSSSAPWDASCASTQTRERSAGGGRVSPEDLILQLFELLLASSDIDYE